MGLDTTHNCWHGPYSYFMEWRCHLHAALTGDHPTKDALKAAWDERRYNDQSQPINVLMNHADNEGTISRDVCGPLADELEKLAIRLHGWPKEATEKFIAGLRDAEENHENVVFH